MLIVLVRWFYRHGIYIGPTPDVDVIWCYHRWVCPFSNWKFQFVISCIVTVEVLVGVSWIFILSFGCTTSWKYITLAERSLWDPMNSAEGCSKPARLFLASRKKKKRCVLNTYRLIFSIQFRVSKPRKNNLNEVALFEACNTLSCIEKKKSGTF